MSVTTTYDVTLAQLNANIDGLSRANTAWGFPPTAYPSGTPNRFHTLLMSYWMCGPQGTGTFTGWSSVWPEFGTATFFTFDPGMANGISFTNPAVGALDHFFQGTWTLPTPGYRLHFLMSVDTHAQVVQLYVNDQPVVITGTWTGTQPLDFYIYTSGNLWRWDVSGVILNGTQPALGDAWLSNTPSFVDCSIVANRRRFINADLTPVDLGNTGTVPFGYQPAMYMSVRPGGVASDITLNRGIGGGSWGADGDPPTLQAAGLCTIATPPPAPPKPRLWLLRQPELHFIAPVGTTFP
jgi:hypothetical protein